MTAGFWRACGHLFRELGAARPGADSMGWSRAARRRRAREYLISEQPFGDGRLRLRASPRAFGVVCGTARNESNVFYRVLPTAGLAPENFCGPYPVPEPPPRVTLSAWRRIRRLEGLEGFERLDLARGGGSVPFGRALAIGGPDSLLPSRLVARGASRRSSQVVVRGRGWGQAQRCQVGRFWVAKYDLSDCKQIICDESLRGAARLAGLARRGEATPGVPSGGGGGGQGERGAIMGEVFSDRSSFRDVDGRGAGRPGAAEICSRVVRLAAARGSNVRGAGARGEAWLELTSRHSKNEEIHGSNPGDQHPRRAHRAGGTRDRRSARLRAKRLRPERPAHRAGATQYARSGVGRDSLRDRPLGGVGFRWRRCRGFRRRNAR